jgi:RecA-family ATPase
MQLSPNAHAQPTPSRLHALRELLFVRALRECQATDVTSGESLKISSENFKRVLFVGHLDQYVFVHFDGRLVRVNRLDVEDADLPEEPDPGPDAGDDDLLCEASSLPLTAAPKPVSARQAGHTRTLAEWFADEDACTLPPMIVPKIARQGEMTMLSGRWREGKSTFMTWICAELSRGGEVFGELVEPTSSHWISFEEAPALVLTRFKSAERDDLKVSYTDGLAISPNDTLAEVKRLIKTSAAKLIVIDSLSRLAMRGGDIENENDNASWIRLLDELQCTVRDAGVAVVFLHHLSKNGDARGATAIPAAMDCAISMRSVSGAPQRRKLELRGRTIVEELMTEESESETKYVSVLSLASKPDALGQRICERVTTQTRPTAQSIVDDLGVQKQRVLREINALVERGVLLREKSGRTTWLSRGPNFDAYADREGPLTPSAAS